MPGGLQGRAVCLVVTDRGHGVAQEPEAGLFHSRDLPTGPLLPPGRNQLPHTPLFPPLATRRAPPEFSHLPTIRSVPAAL